MGEVTKNINTEADDEILNLVKKLYTRLENENEFNMTSEITGSVKEHFNKLRERLYDVTHKVKKEEPDKIDIITNVIASIANLDFTHKINFSDDDKPEIQYISQAVNSLSYHLEEKVEHLKLFQKYFNSQYDLVFITEYNGKIIYQNKCAERVLGFSIDEIRSENIDNLMVDSLEVSIKNAILEHRSIRTATCAIKTKTGNAINCNVTMLKIDVNRVAYCLSTPHAYEDVPSTKSLDHHLKHYRAISKKVSHFRFLNEWMITDNFREISDINEDHRTILINYLEQQGNISYLAHRYMMSGKEITSIVDLVVAQIVPLYQEYLEWLFSERKFVYFSKRDFENIIRKMKQRMIDKLNDIEDKQELDFYTNLNLEIDIDNLGVSHKVVDLVKSEGCNSLRELLDKYKNPVNALKYRYSQNVLSQLRAVLEVASN